VRLEVPTAAVFKKFFDLSRTNNSLWLRPAPPPRLLHFLVALRIVAAAAVDSDVAALRP
jgi:hypothetical protein